MRVADDMNPPKGFLITLSPFPPPSMETEPIADQCQAGCLYHQHARCVMAAKREASTTPWCSTLSEVAEAGTSKPVMVKDGERGQDAGAEREFLGPVLRAGVRFDTAARGGHPVEETN